MIARRMVALVFALLGIAGPAFAQGVPRPVERGLKNQMKVYVLADHRLPVVTLRLVVRAGAADEPAEKAGLANLMLDAMRRGTEKRDAAQLAHDVDALGGEIKVHAGRDDMSITGRFLARDWRKGLEIMSDIAQNAAFRGADVEKSRQSILTSLEEDRQHTDRVAQDHVNALVYGTHPYGRPIAGDGGSVSNITRDDLVQFYGKTFVSNLAFLVIVGDVDLDGATNDVEAAFRDWESKAPASRPGPDLPAFDANRIRVLDGQGITQAQIKIGFAAVKRADPDYFPLLVMNYILGGSGSASWLTAGVDTVQGGNTGAVSSFDFGRDCGAFFVSATAPARRVRPAVAAVLAQLERMRATGPTQAEVDAAKRVLLGATPVAMQGQETLAGQMSAVDLYGLGTDWFDKYAMRLGAVTLADVKRVAADRLRSDKLAIVCAAPGDSARHALEAFGAPEVLDYMSPTGTIPQSKPTAAIPSEAVTPQALARAKGVIERALKAHGGALRLRALRDVSTHAGVTFTTPNGPLDAQLLMSVRLPDKSRIEMSMLGQRGVQVLNGEHGYATSGGAITDLTAEQAQSMRAGLKVQVLPLLSRLAQPGASVGWYGGDSVNGDSVDVVWVFDPDATSKASFSRRTGLLVRLEQEEPAMFGMGKVQMARVYSNYRAVDGFNVPFKIERFARGERLVVDELADYQINRGIPESLFQRPSR